MVIEKEKKHYKSNSKHLLEKVSTLLLFYRYTLVPILNIDKNKTITMVKYCIEIVCYYKLY